MLEIKQVESLIDESVTRSGLKRVAMSAIVEALCSHCTCKDACDNWCPVAGISIDLTMRNYLQGISVLN